MYNQFGNPMYGYNGYNAPQQVVRVNGENGARALNLAPNSSALVLDESGPFVWLCVSDGAGYRTVTPYQITPYKPAQAPTMQDLTARIERLEAQVHESNNRRNEQQTGAGTEPGNDTGA